MQLCTGPGKGAIEMAHASAHIRLMVASVLTSTRVPVLRVPFFFPRVRTPCGHGAQVIIEGREIQSDGGEKDKDTPKTNQTKPHQPQPKGRVSTIL